MSINIFFSNYRTWALISRECCIRNFTKRQKDPFVHPRGSTAKPKIDSGSPRLVMLRVHDSRFKAQKSLFWNQASRFGIIVKVSIITDVI